MEVNVTQFRRKCLALLDHVERTREEVLVTKRGKPYVRLGPIGIFGCMAGTVETHGDIVSPLDVVWDANR